MHFSTKGEDSNLLGQFRTCVLNLGCNTEDERGEGDLSMISLELANAYKSASHSLIEEAMCHFWVPKPIQRITSENYKNFKMRFTTTDFSTDWQRLFNSVQFNSKSLVKVDHLQ